MLKYLLSILVVFSSISQVVADQMPPANQETSADPIHLELISDVDKVAPSSKFTVAVAVSLEDGWKAYWKNPGESGAPMKVNWKLPEGFQVQELEWPVPEKDSYHGIVSLGYKKPFLLLAEVQAPANLPSTGEIPVEANVEWIVCSKDQCLPGETDLTKKLSIGQATRDGSKIDPVKDALPTKLEGVTLEQDGNGFMLVFPQSVFPHKVDEVHFLPFAKGTVDLKTDQSLTIAEGNYYLFVKPGKEPFLPVVEGVVSLRSRVPDVQKNFLVSVPLEGATDINNVSVNPEGQESLWVVLLLSVVGGILLNIMPCVLPIISLKVMSFVKLAQQNRRLVIAHGLAFALGVMLSFLVLGALLFILRAAGMQVGWGFQLQDPTFVALLAALLFLMSLLFFGVFEIGLSVVSKAGEIDQSVRKKNPSLLSSFSSGVLATALSTPCSGPFLGTALGLSMTLPPHLGILIFLAMGLGMALPYLLLSFEPRWLKFIPKPGPWMDTFKEIMGFLLLLTVVWLAWVFLVQAESREIFEFLLALFVVSVGAWILGKYGSVLASSTTRLVGRIASIVLFAAATWMIVDAGIETSIFHPGEKACMASEGGWELFSPKRVEELRAEGVPIFIDFTAKWCLLCQANFLILEKDEIKEAFAREGVVKMEADWTRTDPEITQALASFGRNSVPLYVYYPKGKNSEPIILPQVLTTSNILEAIEK